MTTIAAFLLKQANRVLTMLDRWLKARRPT